MTTPNQSTMVREYVEREKQRMQTSFPAKVLSWDSGSNTVELEPAFVETWVTLTGERQHETGEFSIQEVPVCFPRSGEWSVEFPIVTGSWGHVICTKYSLARWRASQQRDDPRDLRRFTMSGATFHPVNLHPDATAIKNVDGAVMRIGKGEVYDFVALAQKVDQALELIKTHTHQTQTGGAAGPSPDLTSMQTQTGSRTVKVSQ